MKDLGVKTFIGLYLIVPIIAILTSLAGLGFIGYVAWHFIKKQW